MTKAKTASSALWTRENLAWLAGLMEGEASFVVTGNYYPKFCIQLNMTDEDVVKKAHLIGGMGLVSGPHIQKNPKHKPFWTWKIHRRNHCYALCCAILPWMGERRSNRIIEFMKYFATSGRLYWKHGTRYGYEQGCRCGDCKSAHASRHRQMRANRKARKK